MPLKRILFETVNNSREPPEINYDFPSFVEIEHKFSLWDRVHKDYIQYDIPGCVFRVIRHHKKISIEDINKILKKNSIPLREGDVLRSVKELRLNRNKNNVLWKV